MKFMYKNAAICLTALLCSSSLFGMLRPLPPMQSIEDTSERRTAFETDHTCVNAHAMPVLQDCAPLAAMPARIFWIQQFPGFPYSTSPAVESPVFPRTLLSPAQPANRVRPVAARNQPSPTDESAEALLRYAQLRAAACGSASLSPWLSSPQPFVAQSRYHISPVTHVRNPAYAALRAAHYQPQPQSNSPILSLFAQQSPSQGTQWAARPNRYLAAAAAAPQAPVTPSHPIFALTKNQ